jgi:hypothetical protein
MQKERNSCILICVDSDITPAVATFIAEAAKCSRVLDQELGRLEPSQVTTIIESGFCLDLEE